MKCMCSKFIKEIEIDMAKYTSKATIFDRVSVRGIIRRDNKYLVIYSKYGDYNFPGGGMEKGESRMDTLKREVKEETGYNIIEESVVEAYITYEKRKGKTEDFLEMTSYYYFCDVEDVTGERELDDYEVEYEYKVKWMELEEIIARNDKITDYENIPWIVRENIVMKELVKNRVG